MHWFNAEGGEDVEEMASGGKSGVWTNRRGSLSWNRVCRKLTEELYLESNDDAVHPLLAKPEPSAVPEVEGWAPFEWLTPKPHRVAGRGYSVFTQMGVGSRSIARYSLLIARLSWICHGPFLSWRFLDVASTPMRRVALGNEAGLICKSISASLVVFCTARY